MSSKNTSGGWAMHRPKRCSQERQTFVQKKERAFDRAYEKQFHMLEGMDVPFEIANQCIH